MQKATLVLKDGTILKGKSFGAEVPASGEVVFNTGMTGYPESFTDPSYEGQILVLTYPLIGNYGVPGNEKDSHDLLKNFESDKIRIRGLIVSEYSENFCHWNAKKSLGEWLKENNIPAISGIDTRALTQKLRTHGTMLGKIVNSSTRAYLNPIHLSSGLPENSHKPFSKTTKLYFPDPNKENLVAQVSIKKPILYRSKNHTAKRVILIDCGTKLNILRSLLQRNLTVLRIPWDYDFLKKNSTFKNNEFDGIVISNGPGDPAILSSLHENIRKVFKLNIPIFGICLGNQVLAIAAGAKTYKMKFGHRAQNQPVIDVDQNSPNFNHCYVTSQNHGFAVNEKSLPKGWIPWLRNLNDNSNEGITHKTLPYFSCQFHPEATPGPTDTNQFFDKFVALL